MATISKESVLQQTNYGLNIYTHILRLYYPDSVLLKLKGRDCGIIRNPFNEGKETLHISIQKEDVLHNAIARESALHEDTENAIAPGDAIAFAELHFKQSGEELLRILNKEMNLQIGEQRNFYTQRPEPPRAIVQKPIVKIETTASTPPAVEVGSLFSFFRAPVSNTKPYKAISLLDTYNYLVGDYAKQRTEKLRAFTDGKQARKFKAAHFDYATFSGTFSIRNDKALIKHSGLLCVDFDHLPDVAMLFNQLLNDVYFDTQLLFRSPSGDGLKWIIPIDLTQATHGQNLCKREQNPNALEVMPSEAKFAHSEYFAAVANYIQQTYGVVVDKSGRDVSRACFLPHDPQAFINPSIK